MKKAIRITIPEPCHEDWAKMTPTEKGKFCSVCTKEVFDFTQASDEELVKRVTQGKSMCGRFKKSQLDREVKLERKSKNSLLPYAASLLMPLSVFATSEVKSNAKEKPFVSLGIGSHPVKSIIHVSGYVTNEVGEPVENATVIILDSDIKIVTNKEGFFNLKCTSGSKLYVKKETFISEPITLGTKNESLAITIRTKVILNNVILGRIAPLETPIETIEVTSGDIEVVEIPKNDITEMLNNRVAVCGLETKVIDKQQDNTTIIIRGTVTEDGVLPLPGANILVKGTTNGTQTDFDGNYTIEVEPNQTLVFSYVGFEDKEIKTSNISNTINIKMDYSLSGFFLGEVIYTDYYSSEKVVVDPYQSNSYFDEEQRANSEERRAYTKKVNAFKKVKAERQKAARLQKKEQKKNK